MPEEPGTLEGGRIACEPGVLFALLWEALVDVLGGAATAALIGRASRRAALHRRELEHLVIRREGFDYAYAVPQVWMIERKEGLSDLRRLARDLTPLLIELTGPVVIGRLNRVAEFESCAIRFGEERPA